MRKRRIIVSLFAGGGGFDCGLAAAGLKPSVAIDSDRICVESLRKNGVRRAICKDIADVTGTELTKLARTRRRQIDVICAGPPCQPFSKSANWKHGRPLGFRDERADTVGQLMRLVEETLPKVLLIENVEGFAKRGGLKRIRASLRAINDREDTRYKASVRSLDAAHYGVPQHRRRLFIVAHRQGKVFVFPHATHGEGDGLQPFLTAWDAIGPVRTSTKENLAARGRWAKLLPTVPEGENYLFHTPHGGGRPLFGWRTRYWNFLLKLSKQRPSWTLSASPSQNAGPFHWQNRELSTYEMQRLQSFPSTWRFAGQREERVRQIGNAVPPLLAEHLARAIKVQLLDGTQNAKRPRLSMRRCRAKMPKQALRKLPKRYVDLIGDHDDHPGTGLGPGAVRRQNESQSRKRGPARVA